MLPGKKSGEIQTQALNLIYDTTSKAQALQKQHQTMITQCQDNQNTADILHSTISIINEKAKLIEEKKAELRSKQKQLISLQALCIDLIQNPLPSKSNNVSNYLIIVSVLTKIQEIITKLTASAVDNHSIAINITDIFPVIEAFTNLFNTLESNQIIHETSEEKEKRKHLISQLHDFILPRLQTILGSLEEEEIFEEEENENEKKDETDISQQPKIIIEQPTQDNSEDTNKQETQQNELDQTNDQKTETS